MCLPHFQQRARLYGQDYMVDVSIFTGFENVFFDDQSGSKFARL